MNKKKVTIETNMNNPRVIIILVPFLQWRVVWLKTQEQM